MPWSRTKSPSDESQATESTEITSASSTSELTAPRIAFTSIDALSYELENVSGDALYVEACPLEEFQRIINSESRGFRVRLYSEASKLLILAMPTHCHERPHLLLNNAVLRQFDAMGLGEDADTHVVPHTWITTAATTFQRTGIFCKEGDSTGRPQPRSHGPSDIDIIWPTLVIEAGQSESLAQLQNDKDRWFTYSNFEVKVVLLVKVEKRSKEIIMEHWERDNIRTTVTRSQTGLTTRINVITIRYSPNSDLSQRSSYTVHPQGAQLQLSFESLFLRPIQSHREHDILLTTTDLQNMAVRVWRED